MEKVGRYGKDGHLWKTGTYGTERRAAMEKTGSYGKDGHLWKRRALMEKTEIKHLKARFFTHTGHNQYNTYDTSYKTSLGMFRTHRKANYIDLSNIPNIHLEGFLMRFIIRLFRTYNKKTHLTF